MSVAIAPINTKKVAGRRDVHYVNYDELIADAQRLTEQPVQTLGNWTQAQNYKHLAMSFDMAIDGSDFMLPGPVRWLMSLLMKKKFLTKPIPAGFKTSKDMVALEDFPLDQAMADLRRAVDRQKTVSDRAMHPGFGKISREEWDQFNLRHAEMHMSFIVPEHAS
jgi:hypothetical protein